jgi:octaprenyl-diphosphate synthase
MPATFLDVPADLVPVQALLADALVRVEALFDERLRSELPAVSRLVEHVEHYRGKMLRPALVILAGLATHPHAATPTPTPARTDAGVDPGAITDAHLAAAAVCEMVHMATLVHDDVLDDASTRRRGATVNALVGNEAAVILGDYLLSAAYRLCSAIPGERGRRSALLIGEVGMTLCSGELLQLDHRNDLSLDEPTYFEILERKTASLIAAACRLGAVHSGAPDDHADRLASFGSRLGVAFQIQDDLLDLTGDESTVGKPLNRDAELGKLTLPIIHHLRVAPPEQRGRTLLLLESLANRAPGPAPQSLKSAIAATDSINHARAAAQRFVDRAKADLAPLTEGAPKRLLLAMADAVVTRSA